ncbi:putative transcriptional regulator [Yersinia thracica]|uniref:Putative transcriptional regulator n=1 Tax=Yersinia thracica TaxID=2890319 RepID=A0A0T9P341_9GAMM|nr:NadS family protein [Yersinia thracica]CNH43465.1 putative transcriptional regulator [Yersinia thracica]
MKDELFSELMASAQEALAIKKGEVKATRVTTITLPDVKAIRAKAKLKQDEFAQVVGVSPSLVQAWEQHKRTPTGSSLKLLRIIEKNPDMLNIFRMA